MSASLVVLLLSAGPALTRGISLRPRLGLFPVVLGILFLLWVGLMRYALPGFGRRLTRIALSVVALVVLSLLPRFLWRGAFTPPWFYGWVVLPSTVVQVAMLAGLMSAPNLVSLWGGFIGTAIVTIGVAYLLARLGLGPNISVLPYAEAAIITAIFFTIVRPLYMSNSPSLRPGARR